VRTALSRLAARDGWRCWVCGGDVDHEVAPTAAGAPTIDHVLPKALGGTNDASNLRLAHRRCNGRRGSRLPELDWPRDLAVSDPAPLWPAVRRALRRPGEWEVVGLLPSEDDAERAGSWLADGLSSVLGDGWQTRVRREGAGPWLLTLRYERAGS
jgi:hypothetical protein